MDDKYQVKMSAYQEGEKVVIKVTLDDAQLVMKYEDKNSMSVLAENLEKILEYMWTDYLVRKEFSEQIENELDDWLDNI
jgi:hypothetical protein